ncbi:hypothetical protein K7432_016246 [Basidiobolus ranarum]|uniref:HSF-type DNA-binding domain-containing protein n=1 Tax=Basidiobolus ranarum TaxID=34480 RepID=A0ABR2VLW7_9FUNG
MLSGHTTKLCMRISPFVWSLYKILSEESYSDIIAWELSGTRFIIKDPINLASKVLPQHYETDKFTSFSRQLNIYGFYRHSDRRRSKQSGDKSMIIYSHRHFKRDQPNAFHLIQRRLGPYSPVKVESPVPKDVATTNPTLSSSLPSPALSTFSPINTPQTSHHENEFQSLKEPPNTCSNCKVLGQEIDNLSGLIQYYVSILSEPSTLNHLKPIYDQNTELFSYLTSPTCSSKGTLSQANFYSDLNLYNYSNATSIVDSTVLPNAPYY